MRLPAKVRAALRLVRLTLALSPIADVLAGAALAAPLGALPIDRLALTAAISLLLYLGGMTLNGLVDIEVDRVHAPSRPLPSAALSAEAAWLLLGVFWSLALAAALLAGTRTLLHVAAMIGLIIAYHYPLKSQDIGGPIALGLVRALNLLLGAAAVGSLQSAALVVPAAAYGLYVFGISVVARMEDSAFHPVRFRVGLALALLTLLLFAALHGPSTWLLSLVLALPAAATFGLVVLLRAAPIARDCGPPLAVRRLVILLLIGFYLFDALAALGAGHLFLALVITAMFAASRLLVRQFPPS